MGRMIRTFGEGFRLPQRSYPDASSKQVFIQVAPFGIVLLDELDFPMALPFLQPLLLRDCICGDSKRLNADQAKQAMPSSKFGSRTAPVERNAPGEIAGDAGV